MSRWRYSADVVLVAYVFDPALSAGVDQIAVNR